MTDEKIVELQSGLNTAFFNSAINSNGYVTTNS